MKDEVPSQCPNEQLFPASEVDGVDSAFPEPVPSLKRQWLIFCVLAVVSLCTAVTLSCVVPFFPGQAKAKGLNTTEIGFLIGIYQLTMALSSPLVGRSLAHLGGPTRLLPAGLCLCAVSVVCFGWLPKMPSARTFFWTALLLRSLMATGFASYKTSQMAILAQTFSGHLATTIGLLDTFSSLSYSLGPILGSALNQLGGFSLPFTIFGIIMFLAGLLSVWLLSPRPDQQEYSYQNNVSSSEIENQEILVSAQSLSNVPDSKSSQSSSHPSLMTVLVLPEIWLMLLGMGSLMLCCFFYDASLAEHVAKVDPSPMLTGTLISVTAFTNMLTAPLVGFLVDRNTERMAGPIMLAGVVGGAIFSMLIGPSPFIGFVGFIRNVPLLIVIFVIQGVSLTAMSTPIFKYCLRACKKYGMNSNSAEICGCVSGLIQAASSFGAFLGNTLGGVLVQFIGFEWTGTFAAASQLPFIVGFIWFTIRKYSNSISADEQKEQEESSSDLRQLDVDVDKETSGEIENKNCQQQHHSISVI